MDALDYSKHGFALSENREGVLFYTCQIKDFLINLMVAANVHTLDYILHDNRTYVANRYKIENQEELDFLILKGRIGWIFSELPTKCLPESC